MVNNTLEERLRKAIAILNFCITEKKTILEGTAKFNYGEASLKKLRSDARPQSEIEKQLHTDFVKLYNKFLTDSIKEKNQGVFGDPIDINSTTKQTADDLGLLPHDTVIDKETVEVKENGNMLELDYRGNKIITSVQDLMEACKVDLKIWKKERAVVNKWDVTMKGPDEQPITAQNFQVKVWLSKIRSDEEKQAWDNFLNSITESAPDLSYLRKPANRQGRQYMLELSIPDLHIGKLAHEDEVGENYDTRIAITRYKEAVNKLLSHVAHYQDEIEEIILPIGNDLLQIDKLEGTTTAGTKVDTDSRWPRMFSKAEDLVIETVNKLIAIAPVKIVMVHGNHDTQTIYYLGRVLNAYYRNIDLVTVDNAETQRKYHVYGTNLIGFTHGNEEKHQDLGLIMATERPELWAATRFRQIHLGHFHSRKTTKYVDVQEHQGFQVRILPSLSSSDKWHNTKGYMSIKSAVAFLYDRENGMIGEFSHNVL